jgi:hypothetical protein
VPGGAISAGEITKARYVRRPVSRFSTDLPPQAGARIDVLVPASLAPPPPTVYEVLPAVATTSSDAAVVRTRRRNGRMVRVWLERPWLESGDNERLAVIVNRSTVGRDPAGRRGEPAGPLALGQFPRSVFSGANFDNTGLDVAAHAVSFDAARGRWFADIQLAGALGYRPWISLSLARFQADAIPGQHLSVVVDGSPLRLGPDRTVTVRRKPNGQLQVSVTGDDHNGVPNEHGGFAVNTIAITVQTADPAIADPDLRWGDAGQVVTLTRTAQGAWSRTFTLNSVAAPARLLFVEVEPTLRDTGSGSFVGLDPVFVETVELPNTWLP